MSIYQRSTPLTEKTKATAMLLQVGLGITEVTASILVNRGVSGLKEAQAFLNPSLDQLHDPFLLDYMEETVLRVRQAIDAGEKIVIYGDYDADGITSCSILSLYLNKLGADVDVYIPSRQEEGYGIHKNALQTILEQGTGLLITVDCGISAVEEIGEYQPLMDIIITDHHTPGQVLPKAYTIINPKIPGQAYPFQELAGVGVTAKLIQALGGLEGIEPYLDLIAIGTIADIVPLTDENRVYAALGIRQLNENPRPGILALQQILKMEDKIIDAGRISYSIAPCLNAPGRMTNFRPGYELLTSRSIQQALPLAEELAEQNQLRKQTENTILESAEKMILQQIDLTSQRVIVIAGEGWHPGVIGIVASRITEKYCRPSIVLSLEGEQAVGSGRSIKGFHLYDALSACSDLLIRYGGHEMAAGLSILSKNIELFRKKICSYGEKVLDAEALIPHYFYDVKLQHGQISPNLLNEIEQLAPFGCGNPTPHFLLPSALVESSRLIGSNSSHIKMTLSLGQRSWDAVGFGLAESGKDLHQGCRISLLAAIKRNEWMGVSSTQFQIYSMKRAFLEQNDLQNLLSFFDFKVFDVFLHDFMYNDTNVLMENMEKSSLHDVGLDKQALMTLDDVIIHLKSSIAGTAIFVSTYETAVILLSRLMDEGLLDSIPIQYHHPCLNDGLGRSAVILVPDYHKHPEKYYHTIITPREEENFHSHLSVSMTNGQERKHRRFCFDKEMEAGEHSYKGFDLNRNQLVIAYKWLRSLAPGRNFWPNGKQLLDGLQEGTGFPWTGFQLRLVLEIFKELNFVTVESGNQYIKIQCNKNPVSRQLNESRLVNYHRQWMIDLGIINSRQKDI